MSNRHAYLIISHDNFIVLQLLISSLDDLRNDIFVHIDLKCEKKPKLKTKYSRLYILENRIDVRWGDYTQIKVELLLFKTAINSGEYSYFHLLSGVDLPLKNQNYIHSFFSENQGKEFIGYVNWDVSDELDRKVRRYHVFTKSFRTKSKLKSYYLRIIRYIFYSLQKVFGIKRNKNIVFKKGANWVSVTRSFVEFLIQNENLIKKEYQNTFCADEIFKQTLCWGSAFKINVYDFKDITRGSLRLVNWKNNTIENWESSDIDFLLKSEAIFARKFNDDHLDLAKDLIRKVIGE